ncbi:MAG: hypothetical protein V4696_00690 [Pseudomonadota bacterium]
MDEDEGCQRNTAASYEPNPQDIRFNCVHAAMNPALGDFRSISDVLSDAKQILDFVNGAK